MGGVAAIATTEALNILLLHSGEVFVQPVEEVITLPVAAGRSISGLLDLDSIQGMM